jgi:hypothetical protein
MIEHRQSTGHEQYQPPQYIRIEPHRWSAGAIVVALAVSVAGAFFEWISPGPRPTTRGSRPSG